MPNKPKTPNRAIRVDDDLWRDYGDACTEAGTDRTEDLRAHMKRRIRDWKAGRWPRPQASDDPKA